MYAKSTRIVVYALSPWTTEALASDRNKRIAAELITLTKSNKHKPKQFKKKGSRSKTLWVCSCFYVGLEVIEVIASTYEDKVTNKIDNDDSTNENDDDNNNDNDTNDKNDNYDNDADNRVGRKCEYIRQEQKRRRTLQQNGSILGAGCGGAVLQNRDRWFLPIQGCAPKILEKETNNHVYHNSHQHRLSLVEVKQKTMRWTFRAKKYCHRKRERARDDLR